MNLFWKYKKVLWSFEYLTSIVTQTQQIINLYCFKFVDITDALYLFYTCGNVTVRSISDSVGRYMLCPGDICYAKKTQIDKASHPSSVTCDKK